MFPAAALAVFLAAFGAAPSPQKAPEPQSGPSAAVPCDPDGVIRCSFQETETVTASRSLEDMRVISKFIQLVAERNRRQYMMWQTKAPSAAYEVVRRVKSFPYLPYDDTYSIVGLDIVLSQAQNRITVRYPKKPNPNFSAPIRDGDLVTYQTKLSDFIKALQKDIEKLKKYEK